MSVFLVNPSVLFSVGSLKPYSDCIRFTRVDWVMLIYHMTSVILMAISHGIRNLSKTTRSDNSIYAPPSRPGRHVRATSIDLLIQLWLDSVFNRHLPKANLSSVPLTSPFDLVFDLNGIYWHMQKTFEVCSRLVPPPRTQLNVSSSVEKTWKTTLNRKLRNIYIHIYSWPIRTGLVLPEVILPDLFTEGKSPRNLYWHRP